MFLGHAALRFGALLLGLALSAASLQQASALPINAGETLRVEFGFSSPPTGPSQPQWSTPTVLHGILGATLISGPGVPSATFALYDGADLLGSFDLTFAVPFTTFAFSAPGGLFTYRAGAVSDFSSIIDGTIDGVLLITNTSLAIFDFNVDELEVGHATSFSGYIPFSPLAQITSQERLTSIAEPATAAAMLTGLLGLAFGARRRRTAG